MAIGSFVWTDLSTFDLNIARRDYERFFGWSFTKNADYDFAHIDNVPIAAIFPMPQPLRDINMPSFWMSYMHVADVTESVDKARQHEGTLIEIEPQPFGEDGKIALVRDPSGAGFTLYEGSDITPPLIPGVCQVAERYHHLPEIGLIEDFYHDLFGWHFVQTSKEPWPIFDIHTRDDRLIAQAEEVPDTIRGTFRYWMPCFRVPKKSAFSSKLIESGGGVSIDLQDGRTMVHDQQGAHFMVRAEKD